MKLFDKTWKLAVSGAVIGLLVMLLAIYGNPANMAICVACFIRDTAGALKLHTAAPVQYFRPEVVGFVCGSFLLALLTKEYKSIGSIKVFQSTRLGHVFTPFSLRPAKQKVLPESNTF